MLTFLLMLAQRRLLTVGLVAVLQLLIAALDAFLPADVPISHLQYVPIILAAVSFGYSGAGTVAISSSLIFYLVNFALRASSYTLPALVLTLGLYLGVGLGAARFFADQRQLQRLAGERVQLAVLEERARLAREIHDTVAQSLMGVVVQAEAATLALTAGNSADGVERVQRLQRLAEDSLAEVRRSILGLTPAPLEQHPLPQALALLVARLAIYSPVPIQYAPEDACPPLLPARAAGLYRIAQEALTNALKHGAATQITLTLDCEDDELVLTVQDDGCGFDPATVALTGNGFGLRGMQERACQLGAVFHIQSAPQRGTRVRVVLPLGVAQAEDA